VFVVIRTNQTELTFARRTIRPPPSRVNPASQAVSGESDAA